MQLLLIRHASNDWVGKRLAGWTEGVHLNEKGRAEAARLAGRLAGVRLDAIYSSPLDRAMETAAFVAAPHGLTVGVLPDVGEVRFGSWEGRELDALREEALWLGVQSFPSGTRFPGGENMAEVQSRAVAAVERLRVGHEDEMVAIVSHGDVIKALVAHYMGCHLDMFQRLVVAPASLSVLRVGGRAPRLLLFNDTGSVPQPPEPSPEARDQGAAHG